MVEKTKEELHRNARTFEAANTGNPLKNLEQDLDHAASEAKATNVAQYGPDMEAVIVVSSDTFLKMAVASIGVVANAEGRAEVNDKDRQVLVNTLRTLLGERHNQKYDGVWAGVGVMVDDRADYIAVAIGSFEREVGKSPALNAAYDNASARFADREDGGSAI